MSNNPDSQTGMDANLSDAAFIPPPNMQKDMDTALWNMLARFTPLPGSLLYDSHIFYDREEPTSRQSEIMLDTLNEDGLKSCFSAPVSPSGNAETYIQVPADPRLWQQSATYQQLEEYLLHQAESGSHDSYDNDRELETADTPSSRIFTTPPPEVIAAALQEVSHDPAQEVIDAVLENLSDNDEDDDAGGGRLEDEFEALMMMYNEESDEDGEPEGLVFPTIDPNEKIREEMNFIAKVREYFNASDEKHRDFYRDAAVKFQALGKTSEAEFLDDEYAPIVGDESKDYEIRCKVGMRLENHMPHFRILARGKPAVKDAEPKPDASANAGEKNPQSEPEAPADASESNNEPDPDNSADGDQEAQPEGSANDKYGTTFKPMHYGKEVTKDPYETFSSMISVYVNFEAYRGHYLVDCRPDANITEDQEAYLEDLPEAIKERIQKMNDEGRMPFMFEISFDITKTGNERIFQGIPVWATKIVDVFRTGRITALLQGHDNLHHAANILAGEFAKTSLKGSPLRQYQKLKASRLVLIRKSLNIPDIKDGDQEDDLHYQPRRVFHNKDEYCTINAVSVLSEERKEHLDVQSFGENARLRCVRLPGTGQEQTVCLGFLPVPENSTFRASTGSRCDIIFLNRGESDDITFLPEETKTRTFKGKVHSEAITVGPREYIPIHLSRPYDKVKEVFHDQRIHYVDVELTSLDEVPAAILFDTGNRIQIEWDVQNKVYSCQLNAIEGFNFPGKKRSPLEWNERCEALVVTSNIHNLENRDILADIRGSPVFQGKDLTTFMDLNTEQLEPIHGMRNAPGGNIIIQGPAGTGKSRIMNELCKIVLMSNVPFQVVIISPANNAVNDIAGNISKILQDLRQSDQVDNTRYILRIHSAASEKALGRLEAEKTRPQDEQRPSNFPEDIVEEQLDEVKKIFLQQYRNATKTTFKGIYDERVKLPNLSVMTIALERAGVTRGPLTVNDTSRFATFRSLYASFARGENIDKKVWANSVVDLWNDTLLNAAVIISTTAQAGMSRVLEAIKTSCRVIIVDEAAHQAEVGLIPFFAARFEAMEGLIQIGDIFQLNPTVLSTTKENVYSKQGSISLMARLTSVGFKAYTLLQQYRFVEELANLANKTTYNESLISTDKAKLERRPHAQAFGSFTKKFFNKRVNKLLVDVSPGKANVVEFTATKSRYCEFYVMIAGVILVKLLQAHGTAEILLISAYKAQKDRYVALVEGMKRKDVAGIDRVHVAVSESIQGQQYDYVIKDILIPSQEPSIGFQGDHNRLTMELTRARNGLVIITTLKTLKKCREAKRDYMAKLINEFSGNVYHYKETAVLPPLPFYKPFGTPLPTVAFARPPKTSRETAATTLGNSTSQSDWGSSTVPAVNTNWDSTAAKPVGAVEENWNSPSTEPVGTVEEDWNSPATEPVVALEENSESANADT